MGIGQEIISDWFKSKKWQQFPFQKEMEAAFLDGYSGLLNAPTGSGKTFAMFLPFIADYINKHPEDYQTRKNNGLQLLWITPLRALTNDIRKAMQTVVDDLGLPWKVGTRTGDTSAKEKQELKKRQPEVLLTTPESLHLMLALKDYPKIFENLQAIVIDEWHELLGTKRGVQLELGLSRVKNLAPATSQAKQLQIWGISATIGNLDQAAEVLLGVDTKKVGIKLIRAKLNKKILIESVIPENIEKFSWAGHLGIKLLPQVMEIVANSKTTLIFTNTRSQTEIWYMTILEKYPEYAGIIAMHHGSLDNELRNWVENALHNELLKVVVCTSSLDLGVDFRPVDSVVQIGSPKGVARFMQRAGRSGHHPGATSKAWFVPTHSLELLEGAALKQAIIEEVFESRDPILLAMDVLMQYLVTLAVSDGFLPEPIFRELKTTYAYADLEQKDFNQILDFITKGGKTLSQYDEFLKVEIENGLYKVNSRKVAMRHRLSMGTIVGDVSMRVKFLTGGYLGSIEEGFISKLKIGDNFHFAGRSLELVKVKEMTAFVRKSTKKKGIIPSWMGGRMPLSSQLSAMLREKLDEVARGVEKDIEVQALQPLFQLQTKLSHIPRNTEFLIEKFTSRDGHHLFFYPFEGRLVHEGMASLFAYRISKIKKANFSLAMNDYGFELLTDDEVVLQQALDSDLFSIDNLLDDIQQSLNATEMARRRFRDIAHIAGLVFTGFPGKAMKSRHLQASTSLLFEVFSEYESDNVLVRQAYHEALQFQLEEYRLRAALQRLQTLKVVITESEQPTPFAFPILVDGLSREKLITETMEERVAKMSMRYEKLS
ncbi:ligase-associated DNA damage response DEXH box helicase [Daejeonella oryzae]|uniref:ligase-associated DNA damage response DEXH box helicase n=1 Tax=Daejeonella oryzae TaxID=1122943 RepID=UPI0003F9B4C0|nr:ligase-associated DNA damage response DEXH box helicase [Daejeonella oryzae]